jgi:putative ABC transport system permease protein
VKKDEKGAPVGVGEVIVVGAMEKVGASGFTNVQIRGVPGNVMAFRADAHIVDGRAPKPGSDEVLVGQRIRGRFKGTELGASFDLRKNRPVTVVGVFEAGGSSFESEVWVDVDTLRAAYARGASISSVRVRLDSPAAYDAFKASIEGDKQYGYLAMRELEYFERQSSGTSIFVGAMGTLISVFFSMGAMVGAMITMYAAVANRQREIGTLRALGFLRRWVLLAFVVESLILALAGAVAGCALAALLGNFAFTTTNFGTFTETRFQLAFSAEVALWSSAFAVVMGVAGGLLPAVRAARLPIVEASKG